MDMIQEVAPQLAMRVSPRLVAANYILEMSSQELQEAIAAEVEENPALEMVEKPGCPVCGGPMKGSICPYCLSQQKGPTPDSEYNDDSRYEASGGGSTDDEFDPLSQVAAQVTLAERLLMDLQAVLPREDHAIAEYLIGNLDEHGYLRCSASEVAELFVTEEARVERVVAQLQSLEPVGIGTRNLRESLLIQLDYLAREGIQHPYAREIVANHLDKLAHHQYSKIASALGITTQAVAQAANFIRHRLNPYPTQGYSGDGATGQDARLLPDVIISQRESGFEVEVVESKRYLLRVAPLYRQLAADLEEEDTNYSEEERQHIRQYLSRARLFIANIVQRRQTLHKITIFLVQAQADFLKHGVRHLRPLTRAAVAKRLGVHESTISRAMAKKYAMLPSGEIIPFSHFFTAALSTMDIIKEIVSREGRPFTDREIAQELAKQGVRIARRTVAKYREQLGMLPSPFRG